MPPITGFSSPLPAYTAPEASPHSPANAHEGHPSSVPADRPGNEYTSYRELFKPTSSDTVRTVQKRDQTRWVQERTDDEAVYAVVRRRDARAVPPRADTSPPPVPQRTGRTSPSRPSAGPSADVQSARDKLDGFIGDAVRAFAKPKPGGFMNAILRQRKGDFGTPAATQEFADKLTCEAIGKSATALWSAEKAAASGDAQDH